MDEREKILHHSLEKFMRDGIAGSTMDDIASELRISKKTIYKYYGSKNELVMAVGDHLIYELRKKIKAITESEYTAVGKLHAIASMVMEFVLRVSERWLTDLRAMGPEYWGRIDRLREETIRENFGKILEQGKKEELINDYPKEILLQVLISSLRGVINPDFLLQNSFAARQAGEIVLDILISGLLTKKGRKIYKQLKQDK